MVSLKGGEGIDEPQEGRPPAVGGTRGGGIPPGVSGSALDQMAPCPIGSQTGSIAFYIYGECIYKVLF